MLTTTKICYEFINVQTGNVIAHLALAPVLDKQEHTIKLEKKRLLLADAHQLNHSHIYWQDRDYPI